MNILKRIARKISEKRYLRAMRKKKEGKKYTNLANQRVNEVIKKKGDKYICLGKKFAYHSQAVVWAKRHFLLSNKGLKVV